MSQTNQSSLDLLDTLAPWRLTKPQPQHEVARVVPLPAMGKPRARITKRGNFYDNGYPDWKIAVAAHFSGVVIPPSATVELEVIVATAIPRGYSKRRARGVAGTVCLSTPDIDNICGAVADAIFAAQEGNDKSVWRVTGEKWWGEVGQPDCMLIILRW